MFGAATRETQTQPTWPSADMDGVHKEEYHIRDLSTRTVTLFPNRAQVVRDIKDICLKPGLNQVIIAGLSPTVDENSIKVEGHGNAIITDIAVEFLPNREFFQDIYPDSDDDKCDTESEPELEEKPEVSQEGQALREKILVLKDEERGAKEGLASAESRLNMLNSYSNFWTDLANQEKNDLKFDEFIETYRVERQKVFKDQLSATVEARKIAKEIEVTSKELIRLAKLEMKEKRKAISAKAKVLRAKEKEQEKISNKNRQIEKEKTRIRKERESFWPRNVYSIKVSLEVGNSTTSSSRRSSISTNVVNIVSDSFSDTTERDDSPITCDLALTYVSTYAYWSPSYDLALSTTTNYGHLLFDACLTNKTSETWSNCKVILSTLQAEFSGFNDTIPKLIPWRVQLIGKDTPTSYQDILYSREEQSQKAQWVSHQKNQSSQRPRWAMFGTESESTHGTALKAQCPPPFHIIGGAQFGASNQSNFGSGVLDNTNQTSAPFGAPNPSYTSSNGPSSIFGVSKPPNTSSGIFGNDGVPSSGGLFGASNPSNTGSGIFGNASASSGGRLFGSSNAAGGSSLFGGASTLQNTGARPDSERKDEANATLEGPQPELAFQEGSFEETGFTSTYELPGTETLAPSSTESKQRVVKVTFSSVSFSHIVVAKYKPVAYLKTKLRNGSQLNLPKGPMSLNLDGSFIGRNNLPQCSYGDSFSLSLGVDPAVRVTYFKPGVKRSTSGGFSKEDSVFYTRSISLLNSRSGVKGKPVHVTVLDQVPVSEDEKLRINIHQPKGMVRDGFGISAGLSGKEGKYEKDWGKALASLNNGGEVSWDVVLNAGRFVKLTLEYQCIFPTDDHAVNA